MSTPRVVQDSAVLAKRYLLRLSSVRVPAFIVFSAIQPVMFVLLFRYVFGGAIKVPNGSYVDYLLPGIIVQTAAFTCFGTAIGLADDLKNGLVERFRSLPMSRSAVLLGTARRRHGAQRLQRAADDRGGLRGRLPHSHQLLLRSSCWSPSPPRSGSRSARSPRSSA